VHSFQSRLKQVSKAGLLTTADLSTWFGRPYATVRGWLQGYEPWGPNGEEARRALGVLERAVKAHKGFPVPVHLSPIARREHVRRMRHELNVGLPATHPAR
jgi:hypothetical protein